MNDVSVGVQDLSVSYEVGGRRVRAVDHMSADFARGCVTAVVGESGSGKSTLARAIAGILPSTARVTSGKVMLGDVDLTKLRERQWRAIRGRRIGFVPQDPTTSLNPAQRVEVQVGEAVRLHQALRGQPLRERVLELLADAGLSDAERVSRSYPHELSGGMRQRVLIAIAFAADPELVIADEPTSALDVTIAARVLDHLTNVVAERGTTLVIITHDLALATHRADHVAVVHGGQVVEAGSASDVMRRSRHEHTRRLVASTPALHTTRRQEAPASHAEPHKTLVRLQGISKEFHVGGHGAPPVPAVVDVSLQVSSGRTYALIGESGSGKSTTARIVLGLERADRGTVELFGQDLGTINRRAMRELRRRVQVIYQSPYASLDPRMSVRQSVGEPLRAHRLGNRRERDARVLELLEQVRLPASYARRKPSELSGGQCQRVAIARALALSPELIVCDEPVSALDASVQAQVLDLLTEIQQRLGVAYLFISHDLAVVRDIAHEVAVMQQGRLVERGTVDEIFDRPKEHFTAQLLEASLRHTQGVA